MNIYIVKVSISATGKLVVFPNFCEIEMDTNGSSRIVWVLDDGDEDAYFELKQTHGIHHFDWDGPPPPTNLFRNLDISANKRMISIEDRHVEAASANNKGWGYKLTVNQGTTIYTTPSGSGSGERVGQADPGDRGDHPIIINR